MKYLLKLAYDGKSFYGFQVQPEKRTVQSALQDAIEGVFKKRYDLKGCSRTDSGVHAHVYYATFEADDTSPLIAPERLPLALDSMLDSDISVYDAVIVDDDFHVRHEVVSKEYVYRIYASRTRDPFEAGRAYHYPREITDEMVARMNEAGKHMSGKHDFKCFMASGSSIVDTVRDIRYVTACKHANIIELHACADGFLYNMVRIIAGTLLDVAREKISVDDIDRMIELGERSLAGPTLPAHGLYLERVDFKRDPFAK